MDNIYKQINNELVDENRKLKQSLQIKDQQLLHLQAELQQEHHKRICLLQKCKTMLVNNYRRGLQDIDPDCNAMALLRIEDAVRPSYDSSCAKLSEENRSQILNSLRSSNAAVHRRSMRYTSPRRSPLTNRPSGRISAANSYASDESMEKSAENRKERSSGARNSVVDGLRKSSRDDEHVEMDMEIEGEAEVMGKVTARRRRNAYPEDAPLKAGGDATHEEENEAEEVYEEERREEEAEATEEAAGEAEEDEEANKAAAGEAEEQEEEANETAAGEAEEIETGETYKPVALSDIIEEEASDMESIEEDSSLAQETEESNNDEDGTDYEDMEIETETEVNAANKPNETAAVDMMNNVFARRTQENSKYANIHQNMSMEDSLNDTNDDDDTENIFMISSSTDIDCTFTDKRSVKMEKQQHDITAPTPISMEESTLQQTMERRSALSNLSNLGAASPLLMKLARGNALKNAKQSGVAEVTAGENSSTRRLSHSYFRASKHMQSEADTTVDEKTLLADNTNDADITSPMLKPVRALGGFRQRILSDTYPINDRDETITDRDETITDADETITIQDSTLNHMSNVNNSSIAACKSRSNVGVARRGRPFVRLQRINMQHEISIQAQRQMEATIEPTQEPLELPSMSVLNSTASSITMSRFADACCSTPNMAVSAAATSPRRNLRAIKSNEEESIKTSSRPTRQCKPTNLTEPSAKGKLRDPGTSTKTKSTAKTSKTAAKKKSKK